MNFISKIFANNRGRELGSKISNSYRLGKKVLDEGIKLGHKYLPVVESLVNNPYVQTAASLIPYGNIVGQGIQKAVGVGKKVLSGAEKLQSMLNKGETLYNQFRGHSAMNSNIPLQPRPEKELRTSPGIERKGESGGGGETKGGTYIDLASHMNARQNAGE